ncbi:MAG: ATP-grasp domain-containing protein [Phycisphaerales bacterium]|nr:MAG: ATP-grasp domain-containing protein [Phycisphaerales bacterium]
MSPSKRSKRGAQRGKPELRALFTCVGRRVELINAFRRAGDSHCIKLDIHGADASQLSPAIYHVDKPHIVPSVTSGRYVDALVRVVRREGIDLLIPLLDPELPLLASEVGRFTELGCYVLVSSAVTVKTCRDKVAAHKMLKRARIDTPATWLWADAMKRKRHRFPLFLKPRKGSAAMGNHKVNTLEELAAFGRRVPDAIVQEFVDGAEHTLDVYTGFDGKPRCVVPRKRLEVRSGEVSKGIIVKDPAIIDIGKRVAEALGDCRGVITVQCIVTPRGRIRVIEINPRFGGGVPLAIHAGADFPKWILADVLGKKTRINPVGYRSGVAMLRYDESVFVSGASRFK